MAKPVVVDSVLDVVVYVVNHGTVKTLDPALVKVAKENDLIVEHSGSTTEKPLWGTRPKGRKALVARYNVLHKAVTKAATTQYA